MTDNRFKDFPTDYRFPGGGVDARFATPGVDLEQKIDGTDTRFQGPTYAAGGGAQILGNSSTITHQGETWTLSSAVDWGRTEDGIPWIIAPGGVNILSRTSPTTTDAGNTVNGTMKNPQRNQNGWNQRLPSYSAGQNAAFPISVTAGDIVVGAVHQPAPADVRLGVNQKYFGLIVTAAGYPANTWAPALIGWAGRSTPQAYTVNLSATPASMPSYNLSGIPYPTVASTITLIDRLDLGISITNDDTPNGYEAFTTYQFGGAGGNYGLNITSTIDAATLHLIGNVATLSEKQALFKALMRHGIQWHDPIIGANQPRGSSGGHHQYAMTPIVIALHYLGRSSALDNLHVTWPGNQLEQPFTYTAARIADLAPHSDINKPQVSRRRTITAVSGNDITFTTLRPGDGARADFKSLYLVRESDNRKAIITTMRPNSTSAGTDDNTSIQGGSDYKGLTIAAQPTPPFAVSDVVYTQSVDPVYEGETDWRGEPLDSAILPSWDNPYKGLQSWTGGLLVQRALGIWRNNWDSYERYTARANRTGDPSNINDFPTMLTPGTMAEGFWNAYAPTILGSYPVILTHVSIGGTGQVGTNLTATPSVIAPASGLTRTYQWYKNGVAISGATSTTYTVVAGDVGANLTVWENISNGSGSQISRSSAVIGNSAYVPNAVNSNGDFPSSTSISGMATSKQGAIVFTFRQNSTWQPGSYFLSGANGAGSNRFYVQQLSTNRIGFDVTDAAGTGGFGWGSVNNEFLVDTYYTIAFSWNTATSTMVARKRINGGSWVTMTQGSGGMNADTFNTPMPRFVLGASNGGGAGGLVNCDIHDLWVSFGQLPDFTNNSVLASFLPTVSKGADGSLPTGTAPDFFFSGPTNDFWTNRGLRGGLPQNGASYTTASVQPT